MCWQCEDREEIEEEIAADGEDEKLQSWTPEYITLWKKFEETKAEALKKEKFPNSSTGYNNGCPTCESEVVNGDNGSGVKCSDPKCSWWFCF